MPIRTLVAWLWEIRAEQVRRSPGDAPWLVRAAVLEPDASVIGHAGFHGPPDSSGMLEIGYTLVPDHRGKGYAHLLRAALLDEAGATSQVTRVRATMSPGNLASIAVVAAAQFTHVGEHWDDVDGTELVYERRLGTMRVERKSESFGPRET